MKKLLFLISLNCIIFYIVFSSLHKESTGNNIIENQHNIEAQTDITQIDIENYLTKSTYTLLQEQHKIWLFKCDQIIHPANIFAIENLLQEINQFKKIQHVGNSNDLSCRQFKITLHNNKGIQEFYIDKKSSENALANSLTNQQHLFNILDAGHMQFVNNKLFDSNLDVSEIDLSLYSTKSKYKIIRKGKDYFLDYIDLIPINKQIISNILTYIFHLQFSKFENFNTINLDKNNKYIDIALYENLNCTKVSVFKNNEATVGVNFQKNLAATVNEQDVQKIINDVQQIAKANIFIINGLNSIEIKNNVTSQEYFLQKLEGAIEWKLISQIKTKFVNLDTDTAAIDLILNAITHAKSKNILHLTSVNISDENKLFDANLHGTTNTSFSVYENQQRFFARLNNKQFLYEIDSSLVDTFSHGINFFRNKTFIKLPETAQIQTIKISKIDSDNLVFVDFSNTNNRFGKLNELTKNFKVKRYVDNFIFLQKVAQFENREINFEYSLIVTYSIKDDENHNKYSYCIKFNKPSGTTQTIFGCDEFQTTLFEFTEESQRMILNLLSNKVL